MKKYLIDTQILIWTIIEPNKLSPNALKILSGNIIAVSQISLFEIAIKQKIGKLPTLNIAIPTLIKRVENDGFEILPIKNSHIGNYAQIPLIPEHRDPFRQVDFSNCVY